MNLTQSVVYRIRCVDPNVQNFYIGCTNNLKKRLSRHKNNCENNLNPKHNIRLYRFIRANGGFANWTFEILLNVPYVNHRYQLEEIEKGFIRMTDRRLLLNVRIN